MFNTSFNYEHINLFSFSQYEMHTLKIVPGLLDEILSF